MRAYRHKAKLAVATSLKLNFLLEEIGGEPICGCFVH